MNMPKTMCEQRFIDHIYDGYHASQRYCFILGAGASRTSGIRTGEQLMQEWVTFFRTKEKEYIRECGKEIGLTENECYKFLNPHYQLQNDDYFTLFGLRFAGQTNAAFAFLENEMDNKSPSYGYYPLSMILSNTQNKLVITTNFDSLVEDALFIYKSQHPLVVGHESLASYISNDSRHPVIAKIHRDLFFNPMNRQEDMNKLKEEWKKPLTAALTKYIPIVIGYAGGDKTLMSLLNDITLQGIYWCYVGEMPSEKICNVISKNNGYLVKIQGFDEILFQIGERFREEANFNDPCNFIIEQSDIRCRLYLENHKRISQRYTNTSSVDLLPAKIANNESKDLLDALSKYDEQQHYTNLKYSIKQLMLAKKYNESLTIYNHLIKEQSTQGEIYSIRSHIFQEMLQFEKALEDISKAIELEPKNPKYYSNRGSILHGLKRFEEALIDKSTAISLEPDNPHFYDNRSTTYYEMNRFNDALHDVSKAIKLEPDNPNFYDNRSTIYYELKEFNEALNDVSKAIELEPDNPRFYYSRSAVYHKLGENEKAYADSIMASSLKSKDT